MVDNTRYFTTYTIKWKRTKIMMKEILAKNQ